MSASYIQRKLLTADEVVATAKEIIKLSGKVLNLDSAYDLVDRHYEAEEPKIDSGSRVDLVHMILFLSIDLPISEDTIRACMVEFKTADQAAVRRMAQCLLEAEKTNQNLQ